MTPSNIPQLEQKDNLPNYENTKGGTSKVETSQPQDRGTYNVGYHSHEHSTDDNA